MTIEVDHQKCPRNTVQDANAPEKTAAPSNHRVPLIPDKADGNKVNQATTALKAFQQQQQSLPHTSSNPQKAQIPLILESRSICLSLGSRPETRSTETPRSRVRNRAFRKACMNPRPLLLLLLPRRQWRSRNLVRCRLGSYKCRETTRRKALHIRKVEDHINDDRTRFRADCVGSRS